MRGGARNQGLSSQNRHKEYITSVVEKAKQGKTKPLRALSVGSRSPQTSRIQRRCPRRRRSLPALSMSVWAHMIARFARWPRISAAAWQLALPYSSSARTRRPPSDIMRVFSRRSTNRRCAVPRHYVRMFLRTLPSSQVFVRIFNKLHARRQQQDRRRAVAVLLRATSQPRASKKPRGAKQAASQANTEVWVILAMVCHVLRTELDRADGGDEHSQSLTT